MGALFERYAPWLRRRASGRLPQWARSGGVATSDLVQDVLHHAFARLQWFESKHVGALRAYSGAPWRTASRTSCAGPSAGWRSPASPRGRNPCGPSRMRRRSIGNSCTMRCGGVTGRGLKRLKVGDRRLIVGRAELGYNYAQLAAIERLPSPDAARKALKRAVIRLSEFMPLASSR